jgi:uncharacterized membrane protein YvbJ
MINNITAAGNLKPSKQRTRKVSNERIMQYQLLMKSETWKNLLTKKIIPTISLILFCMFFFEAIFPLKYGSIGKMKKDWITQGIKISRKCKRILCVYSRNSNDPDSRTFYIKYCKNLNNIMKEHCSRLLATSDNKI